MKMQCPSQVRQNCPQASEPARSSLVPRLQSLSHYSDRDDGALKNFATCFLRQSHEEREHTENLMKLQNRRGGGDQETGPDDWENGLHAMECATRLEEVWISLLGLHRRATEKMTLTCVSAVSSLPGRAGETH